MSRSVIEPTAVRLMSALLPPRLWMTRMRTVLRPLRCHLGGDGAALHPDREPEVGALVETFRRWCDRRAGVVVDVTLAGRTVLACTPPAAAGPLNERELEAYGRAQFTHYFGSTALAYAIMAQRQSRLAIAVPQALVDALARAAANHRVRIRCLQPWWAEGYAHALAASRAQTLAILAHEPGFVTAFQLSEGRLARVLGAACPPPGELDRFADRARLTGRRQILVSPQGVAP